MTRTPNRSPTHEGRAGGGPFGEGADRGSPVITETYDDGTTGKSPHPKTGVNEVESNMAVERPTPAGVRNTDQAVEGAGE
ncbi:MAG TPA: hypothetical protein VH328_14570 [Burkholderiaceae bacterium]|jgi:hypothetical protein|nr:hypothetical protein [Burkholderiaceae bacterium]